MPSRPVDEPAEIVALRLELGRIGAVEILRSGDELGTWLYELPTDEEDFEVEVNRIGQGWTVGMCTTGSPKVPVSWWLGALTGAPVDVSVDLLAVGEDAAVIGAFVRSFDEILASAERLIPALDALCAEGLTELQSGGAELRRLDD